MINMKLSTTYKLYKVIKPILPFIKPTLIGIFALLLFIGGCNYGKSRRARLDPNITTTTEYVYDTIPHYIYNIWPWYIQHDSIIDNTIHNVSVIDTAAILYDYHNVRKYDRQFKDTNIVVNLIDYVTENTLQPYHEFKYTWLQPQSITYNTVVADNSTHYSKYLYVGMNINTTNYYLGGLGLTYAGPNYLAGINYIPYTKGVDVSLGFKLFKFK